MIAKDYLNPSMWKSIQKKGYVIVYRCQKCGEIKRNKAAKDDNIDLLISLTVNGSYKI